MFKALIASVLMIGAASAAPQIESFSVGKESLKFPLADGYCIINGNDPAEQKFRKLVKEGLDELEIKVVFAECLELRDWRIGRRKTVNHFGYVATSELNDVGNIKVSEYVDAYGKDLIKITPPDEDRGAMVETLVRQPRIGQTELVGEIGRDDNAVFVAVVQGAVDNTAHTMTRAGAFSSTVVKGAKVNQYIFMPYTGGATYTYLLGSLKAHAAAVQTLNIEH